MKTHFLFFLNIILSCWTISHGVNDDVGDGTGKITSPSPKLAANLTVLQRTKKRLMAKYSSERQTSETFHHYNVRKKRGWLSTGSAETPHGGRREGVIEDCCNTWCSYEERCEFSEAKSWRWVHEQLCEISIREGQSCRCKARAGYMYECGDGCGTRCRGKFDCGNKKCVPNGYKCDGDNDCGNMNDEPSSCRIKDRYPITLSGSNHGNVMVNGRPVCDDNWDERDAKVVCRALGFSRQTKAIAHRGSSVPTNYIMTQIRGDYQ